MIVRKRLRRRVNIVSSFNLRALSRGKGIKATTMGVALMFLLLTLKKFVA